jgi:uncharacterized repeat protein (TIGR03843 family)
VPTHELSRPGIPEPLAFLHDGDVEVEGRMPWASNATFLVKVRCGEAERPLWDFEPGVHRRELAAFVLSELLGLGVVPPTVTRSGPYGEGSLQWFVDADHTEHYFTIYEHRPDVHDQLRSIAVLDLIANNTDRKSGHCLLAGDRVWAIDNGLCFAAPFKLRTVIWEFAEEPIDDAVLTRVATLAESVPLELAVLLDDDEVAALQYRATKLLTERRFPADTSGHRYPWPLV